MSSRGKGPSEGGFELALVVVGGLVLSLAGIAWAGAWLSARVSGGQFTGDLGDALTAAVRLAQRPGDPSAAWGDRVGLPSLWLYWGCTALVLVGAVVIIAGGWRLWRGRWSGRRSRFGVGMDARVARRRDVAPLVVRSTVPSAGRMVLGRLAAPRGPVLATEDRPQAPVRSRRARVQGDRGSVALVGPTRSGKSVAVAGGLIGWGGPAVVLSVKRDLFDATAGARARRGAVAVFDPGRVTGLPTARWTPLREVTTTSGAARAARALSQAIPRHGVNGGDFWLN